MIQIFVTQQKNIQKEIILTWEKIFISFFTLNIFIKTQGEKNECH
jgi:hypothetical protein